MLIIAGTRKTEKRLGWVAEVCPFCRTVTACNVREAREVSHLYYVPIGKSKVLGHEIRCRECHKIIPGDTDAYTGFEPRLRSVENLIEATNPGAMDGAIALLEHEDRMASGELAADERIDAIGQVFLAIAPDCEPRAHATQWGLVDVGLIVGILVFGGTTLVAFSMAQPMRTAAGGWVSLLALIAVVAMLCVRVSRSCRRYVSRHHRSYIGETLAEIRPSEAEIELVLQTMRRHEFKFVRKIDSAWVMRAIGDQQPASS